jgi:TIR domain
MATSGSASARIFISYRRADAGWPARWLADRLAGQFGAGVVFQDVDSIRPGDDFAAAIEEAVGACAVLLAVIGPQWLVAEGDAGRRLDDPQDWVRLEIEAAIRRGVRIVPVLVDGARMPAAAELPPSLRDLVRRQAVPLSPASLDIRRLVSVLETALEHEGKRAVQADTRTPSPAQPDQSWTGRTLMSAVHAALTLTDAEKQMHWPWLSA